MKCLAFLFFWVLALSITAQNLTIFKSHLSVGESTDKLERLIEEKGLVLLETLNYHEIVQEKGGSLDSTNVILFEDLELTTQLIQCSQTSVLDMPMKLLIWEENEDVYIGFIDPHFMRRRFLIQDCPEILDEMTSLIVRLVNKAIRKG